MSLQSITEQVVPVNMQSSDNWYTLGEIVNATPAVPATKYLDTQVSSNETSPLAPKPSGAYGYLTGTQSVATNQPLTPQYNCGDYFCSVDAYPSQ